MGELAIATCRVSTKEQEEDNSLNRQREAVLRAAQELGVTIQEDGWWSGSVSSMRGKNVDRKDINEMLAYCKKHSRVKYLIVDEPDRFMRSIDEAAFFEVTFRRLGVTVWYASDPELNKGDLASKLLKFTKYLSAEGSNEERQRKSISGGIKAIQEGRLPSGPKPGYRKGVRAGIHEINPLLATPIQKTLKRLASRVVDPTNALKELNASDFGRYYTKIKMDRFRRLACEPYYAGIIELGGQFNERNENGLHQPLITKSEHEQILRVFDRNPKKQSGHNKNKNKIYPLSNNVTCPDCENDGKKYPRLTSCPLNNGTKRKTTRQYEKYRCRSCNRYFDKQKTHDSFSKLLNEIVLTKDKLEKLRVKLVKTFNSKHLETRGEIQRLEIANDRIQESIANKVDAVTDPSNAIIREEIMSSIQKLRDEMQDNLAKIDSFNNQHNEDLGEFLEFAFSFLNDKGRRFFELTPENMQRCKQLVFPDKIYINSDGNVYTNQISPIFRGPETKRDTEVSSKSNVVRVQGL